MASEKQAISVRSTRLNQIILGRSNAIGELPANGSINTKLADALNRESLLDALSVLYSECHKESQKKSSDKLIVEFVNKYRPVMEETKVMRVHLGDFAIKDLIGKGYFGEVNLVYEKKTQDIYAMKRIRKMGITMSQVREERDIMAAHKSDWITSLQYAFQDQDYLYLVMEYLPGGDLLSLMIRNGAFDEDLARFYLAELTQALNTLHDMGYVHRDIKPENILLDRCGHLKLADFGNASTLNKDGSVISLSPVGTPDYIAPELLQTLSTIKITKTVHDVTCDYWSMGIIGYELVTEVTPFHEDNVHETYSRILCHCENNHKVRSLVYPDKTKVSDEFKDLIDHLVTNVHQRLTYKKIINHAFFKGINWDTLRDQVPPFIPSVSGDDDISNFEDVDRKGRRNTFQKRPMTPNRKNDFSGENLPFIGFSYVHQQKTDDPLDPTLDNQMLKLKAKIKEQSKTITSQNIEIKQLQRDAMTNERRVAEMSSTDKMMREAKIELSALKESLKEKAKELASSKTEIKTLRSSLKIEEEQRLKSDTSIAEVLQSTYQKWEKAKKQSDMNYEKQIAEKRQEIQQLNGKLMANETELKGQLNECSHLQETVRNYKEMLKQSKDQLTSDRAEFEKSKQELVASYEQKIVDLKEKVKAEKNLRVKGSEEQRTLRNELRDSIHSRDSITGVKKSLDKTMLEMRSRINQQIDENRQLREAKVAADKALSDLQCRYEELSQQIASLEEAKQKQEQMLLRANVNSNRSSLNEDENMQYSSAQGSLQDFNAALAEEQLRHELMTAKENEVRERKRADDLEKIKNRLEDVVAKMESNTVGGLLERQNSKLEDQLLKVREEAIVERQASRSAFLSVYKLEKQVDDLTSEKKLASRRAELMEQKLSKMREEKQELEGKVKIGAEQTANRERDIVRLQREIEQLREAVKKETATWKRSEEERMKEKREIIEYIAKIQKLEEFIEEGKQRLVSLQQRNETLALENKRLTQERDDETSEMAMVTDSLHGMQVKYENLNHNYNMLKEACNITDVQMTEMEQLLEREMKRNTDAKSQLENQQVLIREKDSEMSRLREDLSKEVNQRESLEQKCQQLQQELVDARDQLEKVATNLSTQQESLIAKTSTLFNAQENLEVLNQEVDTLQQTNDNYLKEIEIMKEENSKVLTEYFLLREEGQKMTHNYQEAQVELNEMRQEVDHLNQILAEQKNYYVQRDIKSEATLAQHKKLIDYLQARVEELSNKKKKSLVEKLFGSNDNTDAGVRKENIPPSTPVTDTLPYRKMQEDLRRERCRNNQLKEKLLRTKSELIRSQEHTPSAPAATDVAEDNDVVRRHTVRESSTSDARVVRSPAKNEERLLRSNQIGWSFKEASAAAAASKEVALDSTTDTSSTISEGHRFELTLESPSTASNLSCLACKKIILTSSTFMRCKGCHLAIHRKCRTNVTGGCDSGESAMLSSLATTGPSIERLDEVDGGNIIVTAATIESHRQDYGGELMFRPTDLSPPVLVHCVYEINEDCLLVGCATGLYSYHVSAGQLVHIQGLNCVNYIEVNRELNKAILIADQQENLYQCDVRHLLTRGQSNGYGKPKLEATVLDLPFANRNSNERWHLVQISGDATRDNIMAIAATSSRIVLLKYDAVGRHIFKPVRALDTATAVSNILFTEHSAIVSSDKYFEIDLSTYTAEEFVDISDASTGLLKRWCPMAAFRISKNEFLLCFEESGIYVDEFGCRSRSQEINWTYTPTGFMFCHGILFISHFNMVQIMRIYRSSAHEITVNYEDHESVDADGSLIENIKAFIPLSRPQLLNRAGKLNVFCLVTRPETEKQEVIMIDGMKSLRAMMSASVETLATSSNFTASRSSSQSTLN